MQARNDTAFLMLFTASKRAPVVASAKPHLILSSVCIFSSARLSTSHTATFRLFYSL